MSLACKSDVNLLEVFVYKSNFIPVIAQPKLAVLLYEISDDN
jgi:hypothetical protein